MHAHGSRVAASLGERNVQHAEAVVRRAFELDAVTQICEPPRVVGGKQLLEVGGEDLDEDEAYDGEDSKQLIAFWISFSRSRRSFSIVSSSCSRMCAKRPALTE